jgi:hypothetical protein
MYQHGKAESLMVAPPVDLSRLTPMSPDETASLMLITGDQYLFRYRDRAGAVNYKFVSPASVRAAFVQETIDTGWLPNHAHRWGIARQGEWLLMMRSPKRNSFAFTSNEGNETVTLNVPMPALAFFGYGQRYYLWAFTERELGGNSSLFAAPLPNIDGNGAICFRQNVLPSASAKTIGEVWNLFLRSPFSNHSVNGKSRVFPDDVRMQLEQLGQSARRRYPLRDLVPLHQTAQQMVDSILRGIRA